MPADQTSKYRYPGTKPFEATDYALFKGRDEDIVRLYDFVFTENPFVLFSRSGLGKSSLLNAGLYNKIVNENKATPLFIRFGAYYRDAKVLPLEKLCEIISKEKTVGEDNFFDKLTSEVNNKQCALWYSFKSIMVNDPAKNSFVLIFDQFEEFFTYPKDAIEQFKKELAQLIYIKVPQELRDHINEKRKTTPDFLSKEEANLVFAPLDIRLLFAIRSDKLSLLNSLKGSFPTILKNCYELRPLDRDQAKEAIVYPAQLQESDFQSGKFMFNDEVLDYILDSLTQTNNQDAADAFNIEKPEIETFQLQIVCKYAEDMVIEKKLKEITKKDLGDVKLIFENQYKKIIDKLPAAQQLPARILMEEKLIVEKTRVSMPEISLLKDCKDKGLTSELITTLVDTHIIRRNQGGSVEISHDTLIEPILKYYDERKKQVQKKRDRITIVIVSVFLVAVICFTIIYNQKQVAEANRQKELADKQKDSAKHEQQQTIHNYRLITEALGIENQGSQDTAIQNFAPSFNALSRALNEYKADSRTIEPHNINDTFVTKYLRSVQATDNTDWNVAFVIWCFKYNEVMKNKLSDFINADSPDNFLKQLTQKGYVINAPHDQLTPGDIVFFDFGKHKGSQVCGIVFNIDVDKDYVYSIEGDKDGKVKIVTRYLGDISSYARIPAARIFLLAGNQDKVKRFDTLQNQFTGIGFNIIGSKYLNDVGRPDYPEIRFYNDIDEKDAIAIAKFLELKIGRSQNIVVKQYQSNSAKRGYIEVWLGR